MQEHRLYRGQASEYRYKRFVPSALRQECIEYMEHEIFGPNKQSIETWRKKCRFQPQKRQRKYIDCSLNAFYAYWLSLMNCAIAVIQNKIVLLFCNSQFFTGWEQDAMVVPGISSQGLHEKCFERAKAFFDSDEKDSPLSFQEILHDYAFFQHFNHVLCKLDKNNKTKPLFPTLVLDWTWDFSMAEKFAGENGNVVSISVECYKLWNPPRRIKIPSSEQNAPLYKIDVPGLETYKNAPFWGSDDYTHSWDNNLMMEQKGAVIFWPWDYTVDDLLSNDLGRALNFRLEK